MSLSLWHARFFRGHSSMYTNLHGTPVHDLEAVTGTAMWIDAMFFAGWMQQPRADDHGYWYLYWIRVCTVSYHPWRMNSTI